MADGGLMKRLKLKHGYHDATIRWFRFHDSNLELGVDLCGCCNPLAGPAVLSLLGVRNREEVGAALEAAQAKNLGREYVDEIIGIILRDQGYLLDLSTAGALHVNARGVDET